MIQRRLLMSALAGLAMVLAAAPAPAQDGPAAPVERLHESLIGVMQDAAGLGFEGRQAALAGVLPEVFVFPVMARIVAGGHWDGFSEAERTALIETYQALSVATYANRFDGFAGERFVTGTVQEIRGGSHLVRSQIVRPDDEPVEIDYVVRQVDGAWRIVDVVLDGALSEVSRQRSEYTAVLNRGGHAALLTDLQAAIARQGG